MSPPTCHFYQLAVNLSSSSFPCKDFVTYISEEYLEEIPKSPSANEDHIITMRQRRNKVNYYPPQLYVSQACRSPKASFSSRNRCFTNHLSVMLKKQTHRAAKTFVWVSPWGGRISRQRGLGWVTGSPTGSYCPKPQVYGTSVRTAGQCHPETSLPGVSGGLGLHSDFPPLNPALSERDIEIIGTSASQSRGQTGERRLWRLLHRTIRRNPTPARRQLLRPARPSPCPL